MAGGSGFRNGLANLAVQYNYTSIAVAVLLWDQIYASVPSWSSSVLSSFVFLGSIVGMLTFGYLGDVWGRPAAMGFTLALMAAGALGSAVLSWGGVYTCTLLVAAWRFVLGVGIGGVYPLSAAGAYEDDGGVAGGAAGQSTPRSAADGGSASERKARRRTRVAWALFWQQPGQMLPYLLALLLLAVAKHSDEATQYRVVLGVGALPPVLLLAHASRRRWANAHAKGSAAAGDRPLYLRLFVADERAVASGDGWLALPKAYWALARDPSLNKHLAGTALCWFLFDVYVYGISLYTPEILEKIFGSTETVAADYWENVLSVAATLPASLASVWLLGKVPSRSLQAVGFGVAAAAFLLVALCWAYLEKHSKTGLFLLFLLQKNASLFGVATTTFVLPNELFPRRVRASCNGLSAAAGKAGAFLGSFLFPYVYDGLSMAAVFYVCALVALAGLAATLMLLPPMPAGGEDNEDDDEREAALLSRGGKGESPTEVSALLAA